MDWWLDWASCLRRAASWQGRSFVTELVGQRVFLRSPAVTRDAKRFSRLSGDPIHKLFWTAIPDEGREVVPARRLSRFENGVGVKELIRVGDVPGG